MMTAEEWKALAQKTLRAQPVKAPPFLWTRILQGIEAQEALRAPWWTQWLWMTRLTLAAGATVAAFVIYSLQPTQELPLETLLEGQSHPHAAIQVASTRWINPEHTAGIVLEDPAWVDD